MVQMAEHLSRKCEVLNSTAELPETKKNRKKDFNYINVIRTLCQTAKHQKQYEIFSAPKSTL
jgi:cellulase/cellobiase CelA1